MADYLTTHKFPARKYEEGGSVRSQQTSTKISIREGMSESESKYPGGRGSPLSLPGGLDTNAEYVNIYHRIIICPRH